MNLEQQSTILTIGLYAAFADGIKDERERARAQIRQLAESLASESSATTGMAFSFATTYALGQLAKRYYAGGRVMSTELLRDTFQDLLGRRNRCRRNTCRKSGSRPKRWTWAASWSWCAAADTATVIATQKKAPQRRLRGR